MAKLLLGREVTAALDAALSERITALKVRGVIPTLAILRLGADEGDLSYERAAVKRAEQTGVAVRSIVLPEDINAETLIGQIEVLNADASVHGVLLFRPLPAHLRPEEGRILNALDTRKDVDCMTDLSFAGVFEGRKDLGFAPCTPEGCLALLDHYGIECEGKNAVVIGRSLVVGRPLAMMLMARNATVTICHTRTADIARVARSADILIASAGVLGLLTADFVRPGQIVIDVSTNWDPEKPGRDGRKGGIAGDALFSEIEPIVDAVTPVPGGVGPVTASVLMSHVVRAAEMLSGK